MPFVEDMLMITPAPRRAMRVPTAWATRNMPRRLTAMMRSHSCGGISRNALRADVPALLASTSTRPRAASADATSRLASSSGRSV